MIPLDGAWLAAARTAAVVGSVGATLLLAVASALGYPLVEPSRRWLGYALSLFAVIAVPTALFVRYEVYAPALVSTLLVFGWPAVSAKTSPAERAHDELVADMPRIVAFLLGTMLVLGLVEHGWGSMGTAVSAIQASWPIAVLAGAVVGLVGATAGLLAAERSGYSVLGDDGSGAVLLGGSYFGVFAVPAALLVGAGAVWPAVLGVLWALFWQPTSEPVGEPLAVFALASPAWIVLLLIVGGVEYWARTAVLG